MKIKWAICVRHLKPGANTVVSSVLGIIILQSILWLPQFTFQRSSICGSANSFNVVAMQYCSMTRGYYLFIHHVVKRYSGCFPDSCYTSAAKNMLVCVLEQILRNICTQAYVLRTDVSGAQRMQTSNLTRQCPSYQSRGHFTLPLVCVSDPFASRPHQQSILAALMFY